MTAGDATTVNAEDEVYRARTWGFLNQLLQVAQIKLEENRNLLVRMHDAEPRNKELIKSAERAISRTSQLIDGIASQLYFGSGAFADKQNRDDEDHLTEPQKQRFWLESAPLFDALASEIHPQTAQHLVEALHHLLPCAPRAIFLTAAKSITSSSAVGYQNESLAVKPVVGLIQTALADYRDIFKADNGQESDCLVALLRVLDLFVEAGWPEARQLTHRLEEIYR